MNNVATVEINLDTADLQELYTELNDAIAQSVHGIVRACRILGQLKQRGETHPVMYTGVFRWFEQICDGSIEPAVITKFLGDEKIISRVISLSPELQRKLVETSTVTVVEIDRKGKIVEIEKHLTRLNSNQLDQVFHDGKIRGFADQLKIVKATATPKPKEPELLIKVDKAGGFLIIGGQYTITMDMFIEPFRELGYEAPRKRKR